MMTIIPRATRFPLTIPITYRRAGDDQWFDSRVFNISASGALFGPTTLEAGTSVEVMFSPPVQVGLLAPGTQVCRAEVVRATEVGAAGVRFEKFRYLLEV